MAAAREFFGIVNAVAAPPAPLDEEAAGSRWLKKVIRAGLNLLFVAAIALPLFVPYDRGGFPFPLLGPAPTEQEASLNRLQVAVGAQPPDDVARTRLLRPARPPDCRSSTRRWYTTRRCGYAEAKSRQSPTARGTRQLVDA